MNRLILVRHGGSTGNEDGAFYAYQDSALCLTTNGVRQALNTAGILAGVEPRWQKPGNFALEAFVSEYARAQQTARIVLDQMGLLSLEPRRCAVLNERDYGNPYDARLDTQADYTGNGGESANRTRVRVRAFIDEIQPLLERADVLAFSHFGTIRALIAELLELPDTEMMQLEVPNGEAFLFVRTVDPAGHVTYAQHALPKHVLPKLAQDIKPPPAAPPAAA